MVILFFSIYHNSIENEKLTNLRDILLLKLMSGEIVFLMLKSKNV
jgi:hypothetical protein